MCDKLITEKEMEKKESYFLENSLTYHKFRNRDSRIRKKKNKRVRKLIRKHSN